MSGGGTTGTIGYLIDTSTISVIMGSVAVVMGILVNLLTSRLEKQKKLENEKLKQLQETIYAKRAEQLAKSIDDISGKIPAGISAEEIDKKIAEAVETNFSSLTRNVSGEVDFVGELVNGYHQQALSQAKVQFWFSVAAATVGFAYILFATLRADDGTLSVVLNTLPGIVIDAVAFLFFRQAEQTRERATALYDRLRQDSQIEGAREMVESIDDVQIRSLVKAQIALHMSGLSPKELDLQAGVLRRVS
jgi:hypothetical protein